MRALFVEQAEANRFINRQWLEILSKLPLAELDKPQGAFFGSIFATWNHILVGDRLWMARILKQPAPYNDLRHRISEAMEDFCRERDKTDVELIDLVRNEPDFERVLVYRNSRGIHGETPLYQVLAHVFAHESHHRGHISQMCHERKIEIPDGGLIEFYRGLAAKAPNARA
jgi:uncharacterized damage-inducible protein DinB